MNQPQQTKDKGIQYGENTLFLCPDDEYELLFAKTYLAKKYNGTPAGLYTELPIDSLNSSHTIIPLMRPKGSSQAVKTEVVEGRENLIPADPDKAAREVWEGAPVAVSDHWTAASKTAKRQNGLGNGLVLGAVNVRSLFAALSDEECRRDPWCVKPLQSTRMLRIGQ